MKRNSINTRGGICPHCHQRLQWLKYSEDRTVTGEFRDGIHYEVDSWPINDSGATYECPKCGEVLFQDERQASVFLGRELKPREALSSTTHDAESSDVKSSSGKAPYEVHPSS